MINYTKKSCKKKTRKRYQNLSEELKDKRRKKAQERHQNFSEEKKEAIRIFLKNKRRTSWV